MSKGTLERVLHEITHLDKDDLDCVEQAIHQQREMDGYSIPEWKAMKSLQDVGLLKEIKPRNKTNVIIFTPISIQGSPLSETILEERR